MKFLADMGVSQSTVRWLIAGGHEAVHIREIGLKSLPDEKIYEMAQSQNRILLTFDLDFAEIVAFAGRALPSIIIFRLRDQKPSNVNRHLDIVIRETEDMLKKGAIISVTEAVYRIRRLPLIKES